MPPKSARNRPPHRLQPEAAPADAVERIAGRKLLMIDRGDVVVSREPLPKVNTNPISREPQWRFRVAIHGMPGNAQFFSNFAHAASRGEELATGKRTRLLFVEDDIPSLLADYRTSGER
jgi:hypothetical protein